MAALLTCAWAWAVPAKRVQTTHLQSDGSTVTVVLAGDEHHRGYTTLDGKAVKQVASGDWCYATASGVSSVIAHDQQQRDAREAAYVESNAVSIWEAASASRRSARRLATKDESESDWSQVQKTGSPHIAIILVNYTDIKFKSENPIEQMGKFLESALQYFSDQSFGKFTPQFDILGLVELKNNRAYYGGNIGQDDKGVGKMVAEACLGVGDGVDWSLYDHDGNKQVDIVIVLYAGPSEAQGASSSTVWPCQWTLDDSDYGEDLKMGEYTIHDFAVFNELYGSRDSGTKTDGIGTFCHEFSHCLGLPDFYSTGYSSTFGMDVWSLMDYGNYNNKGYTPLGYSAYERNYMGWMPLDTLTPGSKYTLTPVQKGGKAYKIANDKDPEGKEYFIIENRMQSGWDYYMPTSGLMITHVDYDSTAWYDNTVNNYASHLRMTIVPADNSLTSGTVAYDLYPYRSSYGVVNNNEWTDTSSPAQTLFTSSESPKLLHKPITDITLNEDGSVSFVYMAGATKAGDVNLDGVIDITDVNIIINIVLGRDSAENYDGRADVNGDGEIDVSDINILINKIIE